MAEEYTGVRFLTRFEGAGFGYATERSDIMGELKKLEKRDVLYKNTGNLSVRVKDGIVITPAGMDKVSLTAADMVLVKTADEKTHLARVIGTHKPSSETFMHWLIQKTFPKVNAVVHFHDDKLVRSGMFVETPEHHPYGTLELAHAVVDTLKESKSNFVVLKDHGVLVVAKDMKSCDAMITKAIKAVR